MTGRELEFEGADEAEALGKASTQLGCAVEDLDYVVVDEGAEGVFGLGGRPARIRVTTTANAEPASAAEEEESREGPAVTRRRGPAPEKAEEAGKVTAKVFALMGFDVEVSVDDQDDRIVLKLEDSEATREMAELLKGVRPPVGSALQFVVNKIVNRFPEDRKHIVLEMPGARLRPPASRVNADGEDEFDPELVAVAELLGRKAKGLKKVLTVHPMLAADRRAIHQSVLKLEGVRTVSSGEGLYRRMHVVPSELEGAKNGGRRRSRTKARE